MTMKLEVNGVQYENFVSASCEIRLDALSSTFSFEAVAAEGQPLPFEGGDPCKVLIDDELVLTGFIEVKRESYNASDHRIFIQGRDKTGDLLDSTLNPIPDIRAPITLKSLIEKVLSQINLKISVIDQVNPEIFNKAEDIASPEAGDNAFKFLEKYSRKRQVLLTSNAEGNVVIATNSGESVSGAIQHIIGANDNNVLASSKWSDTTGRFNIYGFVSQLNPVALNAAGKTDLVTVVNQSGEVSDPDIRIGRQLILVPEAPSSDNSSEARAQWELDIRRTRGLVYAATVSGYRVDNTDESSELWQTNKIYQIIDDYLSEQERMLCNSVTYTLDLIAGQQTSLGFVDKTAYTLSLSSPSTSRTASNVT